MRIIIISITWLFVTTTCLFAQKVENYESYINTVKDNNVMLKALTHTLEAQKYSNKIGINPADPTFEVEPNFEGQISYTAAFSFDFPTIYYHTKKLAKISTQKNEYEYYIAAFQEMLEIDNAYIQSIYVNKKLELLQKVYSGNDNIKKYISVSVENGNASILELNTAKGELLRSGSAISEVLLEQSNMEKKLQVLNGGNEISISSDCYPIYNIGELDSYIDRAMVKSFEVQITEADSLIAARNLKINKNAWAPSLTFSVGYDTDIRDQRNNVGKVAIGVSIPIWQNSNKVRAAKMEYSATMARNYQSRLDTKANLETLMNNYNMANKNYELYGEFFTATSSFELLDKALKQRQMSIIDYYSEINLVVEIELQKLDYEYRLVSAMAEMQSMLY